MDAICFATSFPTMGWKWTIQDPTPVYIYHKILWESNFHTHFYKKFQGVMLPIQQAVFDKRAQRLFGEDKIDFIPIGRWFSKYVFTYIRIYGSLEFPHVLPLYVPNKLLARDISYETIGDGLTKNLKEAKKSLWPSFPIQCGVYSLHDFNHAMLEIDNITCLNIATIPGR